MAISNHNPRVKPLLAKQAALDAITSAMARQVELNVLPIFDLVLAQAAGALGASWACLHLLDDEHGRTRLVAGHRLPPGKALEWASLALERDLPPVQSQRSSDICETPASGPLPGLISAPVRGMELTVGTLTLGFAGGQPDDPDRPAFLRTVGNLLGMAIEHAGLVSEMVDNMDQLMQLKASLEQRNQELDQVNQQLYNANLRLEELSVTDGLTGLYNHRHLRERLPLEIARARRLGHPLCLVMADLDHFKRVNDRLGHPVGDEALKLTAACLKRGVREVDLVGRYGGEEFMLVLVDCELEAGRLVADKLRRAVRARSQVEPFTPLGGFTMSLGVAQLCRDMSEEELVSLADQALYLAKQSGRDRVETAALCGEPIQRAVAE